ncbi:MAG TPA: hypothetical protein VD793_01555 [Gemmatimonadales bacterium]|nr:hypothetical protein [Gemmatimonadales bacterium]
MIVATVRALGAALARPGAACRAIAERPQPLALAAALLLAVTAVGAATLPRQLGLLDAALAPGGNMLRDLQHAAMRAGLMRIVVVDRLVPPPTLVLAALFLVLACDPMLAAAQDRRRTLWAVAVLGLAPLMVHRAGELAVTYLAAPPAPLVPGFPIAVPQRFATGALLFWWGEDPVPPWLLAVNARLNLISGWSVVIWATGLKRLDRGPATAWHVGLPVTCVLLAGLVTYWLRGMTTALIIGVN